jgi:hypothetical protein
VSSLSGWPFRIYCLECSPPSYNRAVVAFICASTLLATGYLIARWLNPPKSVQLLGTPIERHDTDADNRQRKSENPAVESSSTAPASESEAGEENDVACGAATRSGRPCRRKVKGGGYCWQHRDKASSTSGTKTPRKARDRVLQARYWPAVADG